MIGTPGIRRERGNKNKLITTTKYSKSGDPWPSSSWGYVNIEEELKSLDNLMENMQEESKLDIVFLQPTNQC